jgi:DNA polymerase III delta prime subunit
MEELLVNKYKPACINDFIYSDEVKYTLHRLMEINEMSFILYGCTGCGKTNLIDCIMKQYYKGLDYDENVLYINNISDQGINFYRNDVKLFCQSNCTIPNKKKLIFFDDFDQINEQSQQVFRSYIDKYKNKIEFIITTSNLHKVINSIQSRLLVIQLEKPSIDDVKKLCDNIICQESIKISDDLLYDIINLTNNTIYRIFNYLEKIKLINLNNCESDLSGAITHVSDKSFDNYFLFLKNGDFFNALSLVKSIYIDGFSVIDILDAIFSYTKRSNILSEEQKYLIIPIICKFITIFYDKHEHSVELIFFTNNLLNIF